MSGEFNLSSSQVEDLEKELEENPFNIRALSELAQHYASQSDYSSACKHYEKIVRVNEENGKAWTALGHCYLLKGEYQKCFTAYQKALYTMDDNRDPQLWYGIGLLYHKFESYEYAEPAYQAVLRIDPSFEQKHEVLYKLGLIYKKTNAYDNAVTYLKNSIACENIPTARKVDAYCHIGSCYEKAGKISEALQIYQEALSMDTQNFKTMEYLGWGYTLKGDYDLAVEYLTKSADLASENSAEVGDLNYLLGRTYLEMENYGEGQGAFQKAIYKNPNAYLYWSSIGILYAKAMQPQDAFECFVKASNISQDTGDIWFNMAVLYEQCNQRQEATLAYQRAISLDPTCTMAAERKGKLQRGEELNLVPNYIHPPFELSEVPFSIKKNEKGLKSMKNLPDINKIKKEPVETKKKESSDEEYEEEKSGESESNGSSPYSPTGPDPKLKIIGPKETRSVSHSQVPEAPRRHRLSKKSYKIETIDPPSIKESSKPAIQPSNTPFILKPQLSTPEAPVHQSTGFIQSAPMPEASILSPQSPLLSSMPQIPNMSFSPTIPTSVPLPSSSSAPNLANTIINPLSSILNPTNSANASTAAPNPLQGLNSMPGMQQLGNMFPFGIPNMALLMGMMPNMMTNSPNNSKQGQQALNHYQMALQNLMMTQMSGMMMNPMMMMQMKMMGNKQQVPAAKKDSEEDLAETLTKLNEGEENDDENLRKKRKADKSKDLTVKKRKK